MSHPDTERTTAAEPDFAAARAIADAVLLEGYLLYPYRASAAKNRARWQFGVLAPAWSDTGDPAASHTECLLEARGVARVETRTRFLRLRTREGGEPWDEGVTEEVVATLPLTGVACERRVVADLPGGITTTTAECWRTMPLTCGVTMTATRLSGPYGLWRLAVDIANDTPCPADLAGGEPRRGARGHADRARVLRHSLLATHTLVGVAGGAFISLLDPPAWAADAARDCRNEHTFPVLAGPQGSRDLLLSAPIILYDHPCTAPESPAELCDATEIDEILLLRTMTLTDAEKQESRATDPRAAAIIDTADTLPPAVLDRLHGTLRYLRHVEGTDRVTTAESAPTDAPTDAPTEATAAGDDMPTPVIGGIVGPGDRVRVRPGARRADAQDMFLHGRVATVRTILRDVDGAIHIAVTLDDDPATELYGETGRYLYFDADELEILGAAGLPGDRGLAGDAGLAGGAAT